MLTARARFIVRCVLKGYLRFVLFAMLFVSLFLLSLQVVTLRPPTRLKIYLVPHSHDDVGWLSTIDEYYKQRVFNVYTTVVDHLHREQDKRFIIVEQAFFSKWYEESTPQTQQKFNTIYDRGQIEFVLGGWVMNDEASPTELGVLSQLKSGRDYIYEKFKAIPKYGYQIDSFGHSIGMTHLYAKLGYEAVVLNRIDFEIKEQRKRDGQMEFLWQNGANQMFVHIQDNHYGSPPGTDFENGYSVEDSKVPQLGDELVERWLRDSKNYPASGVYLQLIGNDFAFQDAKNQFTNWDKLIAYIKSKYLDIEIVYATLDDYFKDVKSRLSVKDLTVLNGEDFFPYIDQERGYEFIWTGYYTSKGWLKALTREMENKLRATEIEVAFRVANGEKIGQETVELISSARELYSEVMHHDGITGTAKEYVSAMYKDHMTSANQILNSIWGSNGFDFINVYNPLTVPIKGHLIEYGTDNPNIVFLDRDGSVLPSVMQYTSDTASKESTKYVATIKIDLKPFSTIRIKKASGINPIKNYRDAIETLKLQSKNLIIETSLSETLELNLRIGEIKIHDPFLWKYSTNGDSPGSPSGQYIFNPGKEAERMIDGAIVQYLKTNLFQDLKITYQNGFVQIFRLVEGSGGSAIQVLSKVGTRELDREYAFRFNVLSENCHLITDSNTVLYLNRTVKSGHSKYGIGSKFFPVSSVAQLKCRDIQVAANIDRAVGVSTMKNGQMDILLQRSSSKDDMKGLGEPMVQNTTEYPVIYLGSSGDKFISDISRFAPLIVNGESVVSNLAQTKMDILSLNVEKIEKEHATFLLRIRDDISPGYRTETIKSELINLGINVVDLHETDLLGNTLKSNGDKSIAGSVVKVNNLRAFVVKIRRGRQLNRLFVQKSSFNVLHIQ